MKLSFDQRLWLGVIALGVSTIPSMYFLAASSSVLFSIPSDRLSMNSALPLNIQWELASDLSLPSMNSARDQISFSLDPSRPDASDLASRLTLQLSQGQIKKIDIPARVDLEFIQGILHFSKQSSRFWLQCSPMNGGRLEAALLYQTPLGDTVDSAKWEIVLQEVPVLSSQELPENSPFRELSESRWWGQDLFSKEYGEKEAVQRLEIGPASNAEMLDCKLSDWLMYKGQKWVKAKTIQEAEGAPIAHVKQTTSQNIEMEGWDGTHYVRIKIPAFPMTPLKMKSEELFSQLRVRSSAQVSCMLDKQCLILRAGDWVIKTQGRWKILRTQEEKNIFLGGKLAGEMFVLDRIDSKGANKSIAGHYFSSSRSQVVPIEYIQKSSVQKLKGVKR